MVDPRYIEGFLRTPEAQSAIDEMKTGISDSGLNLTHARFLPLPVRLAPSREQVRIVEALESYFTRLDDAESTLERGKRNLERYRASVLQAAVEGRLVPPEEKLAREMGRTFQPAHELLEKVLAKRRTLYRGRSRYTEPPAPDLEGLPSLPGGWCWTTAEALSDETRSITYGVIKLGDEVPGGVPTLRSSNVRSLWLESDYIKPISPRISSQYGRTIIRGGEVLITVRGTLGGVAVAPPSCRGFNISREVAMIVPVEPWMARLLAIFIASRPLQRWLLKRTKGITYTGINIETLKRLPIPLPPLDEQHRICDSVEQALAAGYTVSRAVDAVRSRVRRLRQSALRSAFEGRLVNHDPTDEPASVLLDRIRAERAKATSPPEAPRRRGRPRKAVKN